MREVIHPIDERYLLLVALYGNILPINDQRAAETLGIAVPFRDVVVVRDVLQFPHELSVRPANAFAMIRCKCADACSFEMLRENRFGKLSMIRTPPMAAIIASVPFQSVPRSLAVDIKTSARGASGRSSGSPFLRVNMLNGENMAYLCYQCTFLGARNGTLSKVDTGVQHKSFIC